MPFIFIWLADMHVEKGHAGDLLCTDDWEGANGVSS